MPRPDSVTNEDIVRWSEIIDNDTYLSPVISKIPTLREVCYAGQWMSDNLTKLNCQEHLIVQLMFTAGQLCFGQPDPWKIHQEILEDYINGVLSFE